MKNFEPKLPYSQKIAYMEEMPTMKEWRRLHAEGKLVGPQKIFFTTDRPEEELYDTDADPHEVNNLAGSPAHKEILVRMRKALDNWQKETKDIGHIPEDKLNEMVRPGGKWSETAAPKIEPKGGTFEGPVKVKITCTTPGASLAYTMGTGKDARWLLYTGEFTWERQASGGRSVSFPSRAWERGGDPGG